MTSLVLMDPFRCRVWDLHERLESEITEETCKAEIDSFRRQGQLLPALGRRLRGDPDHDIELIYGARRLFVARLLNKPLAVELLDLSDRDGIIAMDIENRQRRDVSPYERGRSISQWLRARYFNSQEDVARALHLSGSQVSRLLRLAELPLEVVEAFGTPNDLCERWGLELVELCASRTNRSALLAAAREIKALTARPSPADIYRQLLSCAQPAPSLEGPPLDEVVTSTSGAVLFRIRRQPNALSLFVPTEKLSRECLTEMQDVILSILRECDGDLRDQPPVSPALRVHTRGSSATHNRALIPTP